MRRRAETIQVHQSRPILHYMIEAFKSTFIYGIGFESLLLKCFETRVYQM